MEAKGLFALSKISAMIVMSLTLPKSIYTSSMPSVCEQEGKLIIIKKCQSYGALLSFCTVLILHPLPPLIDPYMY